MSRLIEDYISFYFGNEDECIVNFFENKSKNYFVIKNLIKNKNIINNTNEFKIIMQKNTNYLHEKSKRLNEIIFKKYNTIPIQVFKKCVKKCENDNLKNINLSYFYKIKDNVYVLIFLMIIITDEFYKINKDCYHLKFLD